MDRRVKYTKMVLNDSFLKFLEQKPLERITVTEICRDADINRSTYYAHFSDPFDQFSKLKTELFKELAEYTERIEISRLSPGQRQYKVLKSLLQYVEQKRNVFRILLANGGDHNVQHDLLNFLGEKAFPQYMEEEADTAGDGNMNDSDNGHKDDRIIKRHYHLVYASNGCFGMFYEWLMDEEAISSDQLARLMADFTKNIMI